MENVLKAAPRSEKGVRGCKRLRAGGLMPAVLYGKGQAARDISLKTVDVTTYFRRVKEEYAKLELEGMSYDVRIREVQRHPISQDILHLDFWINQNKA